MFAFTIQTQSTRKKKSRNIAVPGCDYSSGIIRSNSINFMPDDDPHESSKLDDYFCAVPVTRILTRRFVARPSLVSLDAIG